MANAVSRGSVLTILFAAFGWLGMGVCAYRAWQDAGRIEALQGSLAEARRLAKEPPGVAWEKKLAEVEQSRQETVARLEQAEKALAEAGRGKEAADEEVDRLRAVVAKPQSPPLAPVREAGTKPGKSAFAEMMKLQAKSLQSPQAKELGLKVIREMLAKEYGDLFEEWRLDDDARAAITKILAEEQSVKNEVGFLLYDESVSEAEIARRVEEAKNLRREGLLRLLSPEQMGRFDAYEGEIPERTQLRKIDETLTAAGLEGGRKLQLQAIVREEEKSAEAQFRGEGGRFGFGSEAALRETREQALAGNLAGSYRKMAERSAETQRRILARVQPLLSPEEFDRYRVHLEAERAQLEAAQKMFDAMDAGD